MRAYVLRCALGCPGLGSPQVGHFGGAGGVVGAGGVGGAGAGGLIVVLWWSANVGF